MARRRGSRRRGGNPGSFRRRSHGPNLREPAGPPLWATGLGWKNPIGSGNGVHTLTSGLEGAWTNEPAKWDNGFLDNLFKYDYELTESPAGAKQWKPKDPAG